MSSNERVESGPPSIPGAATASTIDAGPSGIGGWLLLVAFGQVVGTLRLFVDLGKYYTDPESRKAFAEFALAMYGEAVLNVVLVLLAIATLILFFRRSRHFPRFFICELLVVIVFPLLATIWLALAFWVQLGAPFGDNLALEPEEIVRLGLATVGAMIWIPYTLKSKRVRNTFILQLPLQRASAAPGERSGTLLRIVVGVVLVTGLFGILAAVGHAIGRGTFSGHWVGGALQIALGVWLFRGSDMARIILAFLYALGIVFCVVVAFYNGFPWGAVMLVMAVIFAAVFWALVFSTRFRTELEINAAKYRRPEPEQEQAVSEVNRP